MAEGNAKDSGHRILPHPGGGVIEAWASEKGECLAEAVRALVEMFVEPPDPAVIMVVPLDSEPDGPEDMLVSVLEDVLYAADALSVVPVRVHLAETEDGGMAGDMEVVPLDQVTLVGPVPRAVSYRELSVTHSEEGWRCHVVIAA